VVIKAGSVFGGILLVACTSGDRTEDSSAELPVATLHGVFEFGANNIRFRPCGLTLDVVVEDQSGEMVEAFRDIVHEEFGSIYAEVLGRYEPNVPDRPPKRIVVTQLRRSALDTPGCADELGGILFRAQGSEPPWVADITEDGITLTSDSLPERIDFATVLSTDSAEFRIFESTAGDSRSIRLLLRELRCFDAVSGARYSFEAEMRLDSLRWTGCAAQGWP
jgi:uncharacterized membrane protein